MTTKATDDLGLAIPHRWTVQTVYHHQTKKQREAKVPQEEKHHELLFGGAAHEIDKGERGLKRLREMADLFNRMKVAPRARAIECLADDSGSMEARLKRQSRRATELGFTVHTGPASKVMPPPANVVRITFGNLKAA